MYLVYINPLGRNYKGEFIYEFIFSDSKEIELGEDWMVNPASSGQLTPPPISEIKNVEVLQNENIELELVIYSDNFSMLEAVENIIALGWEKETPDNDTRLVFHFGEEQRSVIDKLYERDIAFNNKKTVKTT
jgi:hypothetical protein